MIGLHVLARCGSRSGATFELTGVLKLEKLPTEDETVDVGRGFFIVIKPERIEEYGTIGSRRTRVSVDDSTFAQLRRIGWETPR